MYSVILMLLELLACAMMKMLGIDPISEFVATLFIAVFSVAYTVDVSNSVRLSKYRQPILLGYYFRIALLFFDRYGQMIYHLPNSGADSEVFYRMSVSQANGMNYTGFAFIELFSNFFKWFGSNRLYAQFVVLLFSIIALYYITITIDDIDIDDEQKNRAISIVCLLPNFAILSSIFLRESIVTMFITLSFYFFMRYYHGKSYLNIVLCFVCVALSMVFHSGSAGFIIGYAVALFLNNRDTGLKRSRVMSSGFAIVFGVIAVFLYNRYGEVFYQKLLRVDSINDVANTSAVGGSSYARYVGNSDNIGNVLLYTIPRFLFFLFSPFPWHWRGIPDVIAFSFSGFYYLCVVIAAFRYVASQDNKQRNLAITIMAILACAVFVFAWGVSNTGTAARHRDKLICVFAVLHAVCVNPKNSIHLSVGDRDII